MKSIFNLFYKPFLLATLLLMSINFLAQDVVLTTNATLGQILTDADGNTLYFFTKDAGLDNSSCTDGCLDIWPVFHQADISLGEGLDESDFDEFLRSDGAMQTTYKGWPLYYFTNDAIAGDTNGEGINGIWYVAKPDYSIMLMNNDLVGLDGNTYDSNYELGSEEVQYFTDAYGRTLYTWVNDFANQNNFTNEDLSNNGVWPVYEIDFLEIPSTLDNSLFGTIDVFGLTQITYKGWPLYHFGQDAERGETKGVSVPAPGIWPVAIQDIEEATANSVEEFNGISSASISPNPFTDNLSVSFESISIGQYSILIYNNVGQLIYKTKEAQHYTGTNVINLNNLESLNSGMYMISIHTNNGSTSNQMLIKQ